MHLMEADDGAGRDAYRQGDTVPAVTRGERAMRQHGLAGGEAVVGHGGQGAATQGLAPRVPYPLERVGQLKFRHTEVL